MNLHLENVSLQSSTGPNHFASKLAKQLANSGVSIDHNSPADARLCFIETYNTFTDSVPLFQRLDGIYFNKAQDYKRQNANIKRTYDMASGVIFQSHFNKELITKYFGEHNNSVVIHNGADTDYIKSQPVLNNKMLDKFENVWCCASSWRPHKRLDDNIRYFLEHSSEKDCLVIAGKSDDPVPRSERIFYAGQLTVPQLTSLYRRSSHFIHLAWLDHCPNVVVDARASGCQIICSSAGGTKEIAGTDAVVVEEDEWNFEPVKLYEPPPLDFTKKTNNSWDVDINISSVAEKYKNFLLSGASK